jgi:hypothetical protein
MTTADLDKRAYTGAPAGFRRSSFPNGEPVEHPSKWNRAHWSFDEALKTRAKNSNVHKPITTDDALKLIEQMMAGMKGSVGK